MVSQGRLGLEKFVSLSATEPAKIYGLHPRKGEIVIGADADIAIWDPSITRTIRHADLHDGSDYTPYEGIEVTGWPVTTLVRGQVVVKDGKLLATKGVGTFLKRGKSAFVPD